MEHGKIFFQDNPDALSGQSSGDSEYSGGSSHDHDCSGAHVLDTDTKNKLTNLATDLSGTKWRKKCEQGRDTFPSGVTYLAHLMGHDTSMSVPKMHAFEYNENSRPDTATINFLGTPLVLGTLYGRAMAGQPFVVNKQTGSFNVTEFGPKGKKTVVPHFHYDPKYLHFVPVLADQRNADHPILMQILLEFMKFHNINKTLAQNTLKDPKKSFVYARAVTVLSWHNIIINEILGTVLHPTVWNRDEKKPCAAGIDMFLPSNKVPANLAHAALRCFHSLVREQYVFNQFGGKDKVHTTKLMLKKLATMPPAWIAIGQNHPADWVNNSLKKWYKEWGIDWTLFFDTNGNKAVNRTCFTPSFSFDNGKTSIAASDFTSGYLNAATVPQSMGVNAADVKRVLLKLDKTLENGSSWHTSHIANEPPALISLLADRFEFNDRCGTLGPVASKIVMKGILTLLAAAQSAVWDAVHRSGLDGLDIDGAISLDDLPSKFVQMTEINRSLKG